MNRCLRVLALALFTVASPLPALDFTTHPFFKHLIGDWTAEGELKGTDDRLITVTETWTGKPAAEGSFIIEGSRTINDDTQNFTWTITHNPATDGYEAVLSTANSTEPVRFEGSVSDVTLTMDLKAITGGGDSSITVQDSFADEEKETLQSKVTFIGDQGQTNLEGIILHKKQKRP